MLQKFINWVRQVLSKLVSKSTIKEKLQINVAISPAMEEHIATCTAIYENKASWLNDDVQSMNLGCTIASEFARTITIESESEIVGSARADFLNEQYQRFLKYLRQYTEFAGAKGGIAFKPYVDGNKIAVDAVHADRFFPTAYDSAGQITGAVFVERLTKGNLFYTRLEYHNLTDKGYEVTNKAYLSEVESMLGREADFATIDEWSSVEPYVLITDIEKPLFAYFRIAQANMIDSSSPLGVSIFARAIDLIKEADKQYSRLLWEFEAGEAAIDIDATLFEKDEKGRPRIPHGKRRLFRTYNGLGLGEDRDSLKIYSPTLRDQSLQNGLNELLMRIEDACGMARGTFSNVQTDARTATELKIMRQRTYATISDNQTALQAALEQLIYAMDVWVTLAELAPAGKYNTTFNWDDSLVIDTDTEQLIRMQEVAAKLIRPEEYVKWRYGIKDDETAKELMPDAAQTIEME